jgi:hypothetical protein
MSCCLAALAARSEMPKVEATHEDLQVPEALMPSFGQW